MKCSKCSCEFTLTPENRKMINLINKTIPLLRRLGEKEKTTATLFTRIKDTHCPKCIESEITQHNNKTKEQIHAEYLDATRRLR